VTDAAKQRIWVVAGKQSTARGKLDSVRGQRRRDLPVASGEMNAGGAVDVQIVVTTRGGDGRHRMQRRANAKMEATRKGMTEVATARITRARERGRRKQSHLRAAKKAGRKRVGVGDRHQTSKRLRAATGAKIDLLAGGNKNNLFQHNRAGIAKGLTAVAVLDANQNRAKSRGKNRRRSAPEVIAEEAMKDGTPRTAARAVTAAANAAAREATRVAGNAAVVAVAV